MTRTTIITLILMITVFILVMTSYSSELNSIDNSMSTFVCTPCNSECDLIDYNEAGVCEHCNMPLLLKEDLTKTKRIAFYLQDGVEILDFAGPMEVFSYAGYEVFTVSKSKNPIVTQGILKIIPDYSIKDAPSADVLAFFGGNSGEAYKDSEVISWVKSQRDISYYFSVCTGAFILAESGLLDNKTATTFHNALDDFEKRYPKTNVLKNVRFVDNGSIITTAGISAGIDGALHLVAKLNGFNAARKTAYYMEYDKWVPGDGLLLSEDDPYKGFAEIDELKIYEGTYEYLENSEIEIKINKNESSLFAIVEDRKYPLFYHKNDTLSNLIGDKIIFIRGKNHVISGYESSRHGNQFFSKLK